MLFDSEMYIGFAGIVLSVDDVNQYWSTHRLVLVAFRNNSGDMKINLANA